ncbi:glycosyltransferase family 4 protein [uncultured Bilophila sp.]|uniref:glycosyltransferase family 4 protein n=1 Tax=uncultured Bilophila sp. TaxID=529385 RepID=UPI0026DD1E40|nr:glycosyltransferase family 4 protein [uncultured Bilophila sp.]
MRVLLLDFGMELRGGQRQVYYLARALARSADIEPLTACPGDGKLAALLRDEGLPLLALPGRSPANPFLYARLDRMLDGRRVDIVHTHDANAATFGAVYKLLHGGAVRLIHSRRVSYPLKPGLRSWKYRMADAVVGVSREIADGMIRAGIPASRVSAVHSGIDPDRYRPRAERSGGPFLFQSIGAFTPQKGYGVLVRAMAELRGRALPPWRVRIVGDGPLFGPIREEAQALGVAGLLDLPGRRDSVDMLPDGDALVVPSVDGEGSSGAIKEGWVMGVPVICSDLVSNQELVRDEENGLLAAAGDPVSLAGVMERCLLDADLRRRLVEAGSRSVLDFTDRRMADRYMALYRELMR